MSGRFSPSLKFFTYLQFFPFVYICTLPCFRGTFYAILNIQYIKYSFTLINNRIKLDLQTRHSVTAIRIREIVRCVCLTCVTPKILIKYVLKWFGSVTTRLVSQKFRQSVRTVILFLIRGRKSTMQKVYGWV